VRQRKYEALCKKVCSALFILYPVTTQVTVYTGQTIMVKTIKKACHSHMFALVFETDRYVLNSLASRSITEQLPDPIKTKVGLLLTFNALHVIR
jgi:hypothetical protein